MVCWSSATTYRGPQAFHAAARNLAGVGFARQRAAGPVEPQAKQARPAQKRACPDSRLPEGMRPTDPGHA
jgi:hypothetical protein